MTDAMGGYSGGGQRRLPQQVIQKMKKNMKKVPLIQKKADLYHQVESQEADKLLEKELKQGTTNN